MGEKINLNGKTPKSILEDHSLSSGQIIKEIAKLIKPVDEDKLKGAKENKAVVVVKNILEYCDSRLLKRGLNIFMYNGRHWEEICDNDKKIFLINSSINSGIDQIYSQRVDWGKLLFEQLLYSVPEANVPTAAMNTKINVLNGTLHVSSDNVEIKPFDKNDFLFYQLGYNYNPDAECPLLEEYFDYIGFDKDTRNIIYNFWGYSLLGRSAPKLERILLLKGLGGTGKSVIHKITLEMFGKQNVSTVSLQKLGSQDGAVLPLIEGKLINYSSENSGIKFDEELLKQIASKEALIGRILHKGSYQIYDVPTLIFNMNDYPSSKDLSGALLRRFIVVEFSKVIPREKDQKDYGKIIVEKEASGVMNKIIEGAKYVLKNHHIPDSDNSLKAKHNLVIYENSIEAWLDHDFYMTANEELQYKMPLKDFYEEYKAYCTIFVSRGSAKGYNKFSPYLKSMGYVMDTTDRKMSVYVKKKPLEKRDEVYKDLDGNVISKAQNDAELARLGIETDDTLPF